MSSNLLREASKVLRERAEDANPGPWRADRNAVRTGRDALALTYDIRFGNDTDQTGKDAAYIATMGPDVGLALAEWLEDEIHRASYRDEQQQHASATRLRAEPFPVYYDRSTQLALTVARAVLGGVA